jgi:GTP-binding protein YchF
MKLGIIGLPNSGKTTLFNVLTGRQVQTGTFTPADAEPNIGIVKVPDERLDRLAEMFRPKKVTPATVEYIDIAGLRREGGVKGELGKELLFHIRNVDALIHVVRTFKSDKVPPAGGDINPERDISTVNLELALSDLDIVEKRMERVEINIKKKGEKEGIAELQLLTKLKQNLEAGIPIRQLELSEDERKLIKGFQFLTAKPMLIVLNIGEEELKFPERYRDLKEKYQSLGIPVIELCAEIESQISQLGDKETEKAFMEDLGIKESGLTRLIRVSYELLGLISFLTVGKEEVRAWTIRKGTKAQQAAGVIHSDMERGFIRAEVVSYEDLIKSGSLAAARNKGLLRLEGKDYIVQDGDVIEIRFNV